MSLIILSTAKTSSGGVPAPYSNDVFATTLHSGTGTKVSGIDLPGKGGLLWLKKRSGGSGQGANMLFTPTVGISKRQITNLTNEELDAAPYGISLNSTGYALSEAIDSTTQGAFVTWSFAKSIRFFDVVLYTGNGAATQVINHSLGIEPGLLTTKSRSVAGNWNTYHRSATGDLTLNTVNAQSGSKTIVPAATATTFTVAGVANTNGVTYLTYLWAHDAAADGIIQCGSWVGSGAITLGWQPQLLLVKPVSVSDDWYMMDVARGLTNTTAGLLHPNNQINEVDLGGSITLNSTGFTPQTGFWGTTETMVYMAIRVPNKP